jgi:hypothetical protein
VIGVQDFGQAKNYKPTWTKTSLRLVFVLRWKKKIAKSTFARVEKDHSEVFQNKKLKLSMNGLKSI